MDRFCSIHPHQVFAVKAHLFFSYQISCMLVGLDLETRISISNNLQS